MRFGYCEDHSIVSRTYLALTCEACINLNSAMIIIALLINVRVCSARARNGSAHYKSCIPAVGITFNMENQRVELKHLLNRTALLLMCSVACGTALAAEPSSMFITRTTDKSPEVIADAIKTYAEAKKWQYLGASKVKNGEVTLVKVCIPEIGKLVWPQGLHLSALLPCGNLGIYRKGDKTEVSMLHARYMHALVPTPEMEKASATAEPLLEDMLNAALK